MFTIVHTSETQAEAQVVAQLLMSHGIHAHVDDAFTLSINHLLSPALGGIKVQVLTKDAEAARRIIEREWVIPPGTQARPEEQDQGEPDGPVEIPEADPNPFASPHDDRPAEPDREPTDRCPACGSIRLIEYRPLACLALIFFPLIFFAAKKKKLCQDCGEKFRG